MSRKVLLIEPNPCQVPENEPPEMSRKVLLIEPNYKNKFPPIGLMKLSTYFKSRGDEVVFYKGDLKEFSLRQVAFECVDKLAEIDNSINWKLRADKIKEFIFKGKKVSLEQIAIDDSTQSIFIYKWLQHYRKFYQSGEFKKHPRWDWVGVTTLFTFYWDITIETINFAKTMVKDTKNLMVGGVLASIQPKEIEEATGIKPWVGILGHPGDIDEGDSNIIDELPLDYSILDEIDYVYPDGGSFYSYTTRGCIRHCPFCAVPILEPKYQSHIPLSERIETTRRLYGEQHHLLLMDNNVLASKEFPTIIEDIKASGFYNGAKYIESNQYELAIRNLRAGNNDRAYIHKSFVLLRELNEIKSLSIEERTYIYSLREKFGLLHLDTCTKEALEESYRYFAKYFERIYAKKKGKARYVDFNQGVDARLFTEERVQLLAQIPVKPLRIAFDDIKTEKAYRNALQLSVKYGMKEFSNYLLYNFRDYPIDLYYRLRINVELCEELDVNIYSFPMKYHPIKGEHSHNRDYIGKHWNRKYIRAVQAILNATKGKIGRGKSFFEKAFGRNEDEYLELLIMPETFIIFRLFFEYLGYTQQWREEMSKLSLDEKKELLTLISDNKFTDINSLTENQKLINVLRFYKDYRKEIADKNSELYKMKVDFGHHIQQKEQ